MSEKLKGSLFLGLAVIFEVISTTNIKLSEGFSILFNSIVAVFSIALAMFFLAQALKYIPLAIAYAIWVGVGTALIYVISILIFNEPMSFMKFFGVVLVIGGVVSLNYLMKENEEIDHLRSSSK